MSNSAPRRAALKIALRRVRHKPTDLAGGLFDTPDPLAPALSRMLLGIAYGPLEALLDTPDLFAPALRRTALRIACGARWRPSRHARPSRHRPCRSA